MPASRALRTRWSSRLASLSLRASSSRTWSSRGPMFRPPWWPWPRPTRVFRGKSLQAGAAAAAADPVVVARAAPGLGLHVAPTKAGIRGTLREDQAAAPSGGGRRPAPLQAARPLAHHQAHHHLVHRPRGRHPIGRPQLPPKAVALEGGQRGVEAAAAAAAGQTRRRTPLTKLRGPRSSGPLCPRRARRPMQDRLTPLLPPLPPPPPPELGGHPQARPARPKKSHDGADVSDFSPNRIPKRSYSIYGGHRV